MHLLSRSIGRALAAATFCLACAGPATVLRAADDEGFVPLFNGKDLSGWVTPDDKELFGAEDGQIVGRTKGNLKKNEFLVTDKPYGDFILKGKYKFKTGNSGIQIRSDRAANGRVTGPQADIGVNYFGSLYEEGRRGKLLVTYPKEQGKELFRADDWNEMVVTAQGDRLQIGLNGTTTADITDPAFDKSGIIALQVHVGPPMEVRFKDVMIKVLGDK